MGDTQRVAAGEALVGEAPGEVAALLAAVAEAARLTDCAKSEPGRVCASGRAVALAGPDEAARWAVGEGVVLRRRTEPTAIACPVYDERGSPKPRDRASTAG